MSSIKMFEKPLGMRDTLPEIYEKLELIRSTGRALLRERGYELIKTPSVEYYDTVGKASAISDARLFKLVDSQGNTLVLRPDMTTPIARVATSKLLKEKIPQRLAYFANVFRAQQREGGRPAELIKWESNRSATILCMLMRKDHDGNRFSKGVSNYRFQSNNWTCRCIELHFKGLYRK